MVDYIILPGTILKEYLNERKITQKELAEKLNFSEKHISNIINGKSGITEEIALNLEKIFPDVKAEFWLDLERDYKLNILRAKERKKALEGLDLLTLSKEYEFDYLFKGLNYTLEEKANETLKILGVDSFQKANEMATNNQALFFHDGGNPKAQLVWLKLCEFEFDIQNEISQIKPFDLNKLKGSMEIFKKIIYTTDFDFMISNIRKFLNHLGIGFVLMDAVPTSKIRGATTVIEGIPAIFMTSRYKKLDSFYFTLIHEIHHLLSEDLKKPGYQNILYEDDVRELKSNGFAQNFLINLENYERFLEKDSISDLDIITFANNEGVIPDIIVGFLERTMDKKYGKPIYGKFQHLRTKLTSKGGSWCIFQYLKIECMKIKF